MISRWQRRLPGPNQYIPRETVLDPRREHAEARVPPAGQSASERTRELVDNHTLGQNLLSPRNLLMIPPFPHIPRLHLGEEPGKAWDAKRPESLTVCSSRRGLDLKSMYQARTESNVDI